MSNSGVDDTPSGPPQRASAEVLSQRRIVSAKKARPSSGGSTPGASTESTRNPFATVTLSAPNSSQSQSVKPFSFGTTPSISNDTKDVNRTTFAGFSFATPATPSTAGPTDKGEGTVDALRKQRDEKLKKLKKTFASKMRQRFASGGFGGVLEDLNCYMGYRKAIIKPLKVALAKEEITEQKPLANQIEHRPVISAPTSQAAFSFGAVATSEPRQVQNSSSLPTVVDDDDAVPSEPTVEVEAISDPDWTSVLHLSKVKVFVRDDTKWKAIASGPLRVEKHNTKSKTNRIVIRDANTGNVLLNCSIPSGGKITPQVAKNKYYITFLSRRADDSDSKMFMMQTHGSDHEALLQILTEMSK